MDHFNLQFDKNLCFTLICFQLLQFGDVNVMMIPAVSSSIHLNIVHRLQCYFPADSYCCRSTSTSKFSCNE